MRYLAIADADRVQEYIFVPGRLKMIRGASALHKKLVGGLGDRLIPGDRTISSSGGVTLVSLSTAASAEQFCRQAEERFWNETHGATVTTAWIGYDEGLSDTEKDDNFVKARTKLLAKLEREKRSRRTAAFRAGNSFWVSCQECGLHPAHKFNPQQPEGYLCRSCLDKLEYLWTTPPESHETFEELGSESVPGNYLAIVYIDIDRLGKYLDDNTRSEEACKDLSGRIDSAMQEAAKEAQKKANRREEARRAAGGKPPGANIAIELLVGGDDAVVAIAAHHAAQFVLDFEKEFIRAGVGENGTPTNRWVPYPEPYFSAAIVTAHSHFPFSEHLRLCKQLLRVAKERADENSAYWAVLTESMAERETGASLARTGNPYSLSEFARMIAGIRDLKSAGAPRNKIAALYPISWQGKMQAELDYLYLLTRLEREPRRLLCDLAGASLWKSDTRGEYTRAADIAEMWEFVDAD
jgi:hypothetical protein